MRKDPRVLFRGGWVGWVGSVVHAVRDAGLQRGAAAARGSVAEYLPGPGSTRRRLAADDNLLSTAYGTAAAPDRAPDRHMLMSSHGNRTVQLPPHRCSLIPPRLPRNACALGRAALAASLLSADLAIRSTLFLYRPDREGMSEAEVIVGARQLARSWFVQRAGCGRGMCDSAVPPRALRSNVLTSGARA